MIRFIHWIKGHPWTVFALALVVLGVAWLLAAAVNDEEGYRMSPQGTYMRLVPVTR